MKKVLSVVAGIMMASIKVAAADTRTTDASASLSLFATISALDSQVFAAFNHCSEPGELEKHASFFAPNVEFYHDTGGVTWSRAQMIANTKKYVCGHFSRELLEGSLQVFPIKDFGAIAEGTHRFCQFASQECEGKAKFVMIWHNDQEKWQITRVLSYAHQANNP